MNVHTRCQPEGGTEQFHLVADHITEFTNKVEIPGLCQKSSYRNRSTVLIPGFSRISRFTFTEESSFQSELNWFVKEVNSTTNNINAILTKNICLNSKSIDQIGVNDYTGTFDGQNRLINGFYLNNSVNIEKDTTSYYSGFFRKNSGYIKNLNLEGSLFKGLTLIPGTGIDFEVY